ncbi:MAG TPA: group II intron maturase-specific domain-containing protein [Symbiobacteriaceae bacterium]|nr:group II intron maturase-specific domain-containing protein [Symbiobacteriaceae bacterium]
MDEWIRSRLRMCLWKQWKRGKTRYRELRRLGLAPRTARIGASPQVGPWRAAHTPQMHKALGLAYWRNHGLMSLKERYESSRSA